MRYVVDTHVLLWYVQDHPALSTEADEVLSNPSSELFLPAVVLMEACWIVEAGKTSIQSPRALLEAIDDDARFSYIPIDREMIDISITLTSIKEIHDRLIVATTLSLRKVDPSIALITKDQAITASGLVPVIW